MRLNISAYGAKGSEPASARANGAASSEEEGAELVLSVPLLPSSAAMASASPTKTVPPAIPVAKTEPYLRERSLQNAAGSPWKA
ncbi:MAG: hypothetical protein ACPIOQ_30630, partial [Promethearchaeia archaeon]